ncbi:hypothetical protein RQP46_010981 [Phenoliferia psychrophenolica]
MPPRKATVLGEVNVPPRARPSRAAAKPSLPLSPTPSREDSDNAGEEDEEEEDVKPVVKRSARTSRTSAASAASERPAPAARASRGAARDSNASASTTATTSTRTRAKRSSAAQSDAQGDAENAPALANNKRPSRGSRGTRASEASIAEDTPVEDEEDEDEDEEPVKPARRGPKKALAPPSPAAAAFVAQAADSDSDDAASDEEQDEDEQVEAPVAADDSDDDEESEDAAPPPPPAPKAKRAPARGKKAKVVESDSDSDAPAPSPTPEVEHVKLEEPVAAQRPSTPSADSDDDVAADLLPQTPQNAHAAPQPDDEDDKEPVEEPKAPVEPTPVVNVAPTAYDLVAQARLAALNHAAQEKEREKEREGKPRLVIHQIILEDFKSYRGRGVIGPFHKSFSSIVGPNGSGKSNTIDALLFVFGYRATKMRQGKLSELIHNSGAVVPEGEENLEPLQANDEGAEFEEGEESDEEDWDAGAKKGKGKKGKGKGKAKKAVQDEAGLIGQCTVEVWFREIIDLPGHDNFEVVPNSQLVVARTAYRNNSSKYTINGKNSTFTEVTTLLKGRGIDLQHKRFLILQGEVESIAQMKPKGATEHDDGLLEYLEDIIGTSDYKPEIEKAVVEVERLNDARQIQLNRVKLVEREKSALEGRKKEADAYLRDKNELAMNQNALFQVNIHQASANSEVHQHDVDEAKAELDEETNAQAGTRQEVDRLQNEYNDLDGDTKALEKETSAIVKDLAGLDRTDVQLQEKKKSFAAKVKKLKKSLTDDSHNLSEAKTWIRNHSEEIDRVKGDLGKMETNLETEEAELEKVRDGLKGKTEVFSTQIEALQQDLQGPAAKITAKQGEIDLAANERDLLVEKTDSVKNGIEEAEVALEKLAGDETVKTEQLKELKAEKKSVEKEAASAQAKLDGMVAEDAKLRTKATVARQKSDEAKASQSATKSQGAVLAGLTKLKDQGRLPGFYGRLGDLGRIDDKYDIAVTTACGGLNNIITETIKDAEQCLDHLRSHNLGQATFMALDKTRALVKPADLDPMAPIPENAPRLFDLITFKDDKFAACFYKLLRNTLVATDLVHAKLVAYGPSGKGAPRFRVVTLDGQIIDTSGTMSGGGKPRRGGMSSKIAADVVSPALVAKCEQEQEVAVEALRVFVEDRQQIEKDLATLRKRLPEIDMSISKIEMDLKTGGKRREEAERRLAELQSQSQPEAGDVKRIEQLEKTIASLNKELGQLQKESSAIDTKIQALQEKILEVGGVKLRSQQTKVSDLKARIDHAIDRLTKAEVGMAKSEKDAAKLTKAIESNTQGINLTQAELEQVEAQITLGEAESQQVRKLVEQAQEALGTKREELADMKRDLDEKVAVITQFRKREHELQQALAGHQKLLNDTKKEITYWADKISDLSLEDIDSDDEEEDEEEDGAPKAPKPITELHQYSPEEIAGLDPKVLKGKISALEERIAKCSLDLAVLKEYARREKEFMKRAADLDEVTKERDAAKKLADDLRAQRLREFMEGFGIISMKLKEMYQMITLGGNAELELVDSLDPFSEGIIFSVMPPKKSWKNISNLSGGEKTLSSLALVFALHVFKPTPLYFMDEIDAALDFRNVSIVANYIRDRTKHAQFVVISLRFELSSRLIGIYKVANQTRSVAIDNTSLVECIA